MIGYTCEDFGTKGLKKKKLWAYMRGKLKNGGRDF